jgi:photosystem II stability/assembly factor-like uncharacterized protein
MSIIPFTNFTVIDLSNVQQPYVNSCTEYGYFNGTNLGTIANDLWRSLPATLNTNNGIASVDASGGLRILNPGIYSINLSIFPTAIKDGSSNISFNFGTTYLPSVSTSLPAGAFGGARVNGMFTYDPFYNPYSPGIISWVADGYSSGNNTASNFIKNSTTNELSYNYFNAGYLNGPLYSGNCTTQMTFIINSPETIYFNVSTNISPGVTMGNCVFTLELISTIPISNIVGWNFKKIQNVPTQTWRSITSSSTGQYLAGVGTSGKISVSTNFGAAWNTNNNSISSSWIAITSSGSGQFLVAITQTAKYRSTDFGASWAATSSIDPSRNMTHVASSIDGSKLIISCSSGGIWRSTDYGNTWQVTDASAGANWYSVAAPNNGTDFYALGNSGVWRSMASNANNWIQTSINSSRAAMAVSKNGAKIVLANGNRTFNISTDSGVNWITKTFSPVEYAGFLAISGDGSKFFATGYGGQIYLTTDFTTNTTDWTTVTNFFPQQGYQIQALGTNETGSLIVSGTNLDAFPSLGLFVGVYG